MNVYICVSLVCYLFIRRLGSTIASHARDLGAMELSRDESLVFLWRLRSGSKRRYLIRFQRLEIEGLLKWNIEFWDFPCGMACWGDSVAILGMGCGHTEVMPSWAFKNTKPPCGTWRGVGLETRSFEGIGSRSKPKGQGAWVFSGPRGKVPRRVAVKVGTSKEGGTFWVETSQSPKGETKFLALAILIGLSMASSSIREFTLHHQARQVDRGSER